MCGITGLWARGGATSEALRADVAAMTATLAHRGPDGDGVWVEAERGVALGHRRLSIIDLSEAGAQPMTRGDVTLTFNGEIYNFAELRSELEADGVAFRGRSDSEVLLQACARWGVEATLPRLQGMFAFALWDGATLWLARDRVGIKPLYWGCFGGLVLFGSELKALRACGGWTAEVDRDVLPYFLRHGYLAPPHAIYRGVHQLAPGQLLRVGAEGAPVLKTWWDARALAPAAERSGDPRRLGELLESAVRDRLVADVPLGCLLSGGIDSSLVTALAMRVAGRQLKTFTIGFDEGAHDESHYAARVAEVLGTDHHALTLSADGALDLIPQLAERWDEPFADSSQLPTQLVAQLAREQVTVVLSGDGGDELFCGYKRYAKALRLWARVRSVPLRGVAASRS